MEFLYDETALATSEDIKVTEHDNKTDAAFQKFEEQVDQQYQKTASVLKGFMKDNEVLSKIKLPKNLEDTVATKTEEVFNKIRLDENLSNVEEKAQEYWSTLSKSSFWSSMASSISQQFSEKMNLNHEVSNHCKENDSKERYIDGSKVIHSCLDPISFLSFDKTLLDKEFRLETYSKEISVLLETDQSVAKIYAELVPKNLTEHEFWNIYFALPENKSMKAKKLDLLKIKESFENQEQIGWDDDDDDDDEEEEEEEEEEEVAITVPTTRPHTEKQEPNHLTRESSDNSSNVFSNEKEKTADTQKEASGGEEKEREEEGDDDDDDWE